MIRELLCFIEIDEETKGLGLEIWRLIEPHADGVIKDFYNKVKVFGISAYVTDAAIERLMAKQKQHWAALFGSRFDTDYANSARHVGIQHHDIALNPMWYVAGYMALKIALTRIIVDAELPAMRKGGLIKTLDKYVAFDMALAMSTYNAVVID